MADEATDTTVQGGDPSPAGEPTPPAIQDEHAADAAAQNTSEGGDPNPDANGADSEGANEKDPDARWQRRVDKLTARAKGAEEENAKLREELEGFKSERDKRELEGLKGLPVMPEALTADERKEVTTLRPQLDEASRDADYWFSHAEDGVTLKDGREFSGAQCREFGRMKEREAAKLEARLDAIMDSGRGRLSRLLKKHGAELLGEDTAEPPKVPAAPKAPPKAQPPKQAPERAPGGGAPAAAKDGAGNSPPPRLSQEQLKAVWAD
jgi:hypothetical protein